MVAAIYSIFGACARGFCKPTRHEGTKTEGGCVKENAWAWDDAATYSSSGKDVFEGAAGHQSPPPQLQRLSIRGQNLLTKG